MDERRKIIIPIGDDPDSKSEQTYFDTQSRKDARPVVPLPGSGATGPVRPKTRSRKWALLVVILVAALGAAGTAGAYVYMSRDHGPAGPQAAVQPVAARTMSTLPWTHTPEGPIADENANANFDETSDATERAKDARTDEAQARNDPAANDGDSKKANKKQKRGKQGKNSEDDDPDNPVKRTEDQLHRIREIFEGPP